MCLWETQWIWLCLLGQNLHRYTALAEHWGYLEEKKNDSLSVDLLKNIII